MLLQLECDAQLDISPGDDNFIVSDSFTLAVNVDLLGVYPHAHYLGKDLEATATLPDESTQVLIHIKHWEINWQAVYRYEEPAPLPKGTTITMRYAYDNSDDNVANPNHPPERVKAGNRSSDEMAHLWLQVLPKNLPGSERDPRMILQEALGSTTWTKIREISRVSTTLRRCSKPEVTWPARRRTIRRLCNFARVTT